MGSEMPTFIRIKGNIPLIFLLAAIIIATLFFTYRGRVKGDEDISFPGVLIWNGEDAAARASSIFSSAVASTGSAHSGTYGFEGTSDYYHGPQFSLTGQTMYRKGLTKFDEIWFYIKSDSAGHDIKITIKDCCGRLSNTLSIASYVEGGAIDTSWRLAKIPIKDLQTANYQLENIQSIAFNNAPKNISYKIHIDDMFAVDRTPESIISYKMYSDSVIRLELKERYDFADAVKTENFELTSQSDSDYSGSINPIRIGREYYVSDFAGSGTKENIYGNPDDPINRYFLYLVFSKPLKKNAAYSLKINNIKDGYGVNFMSPTSLSFSYNESEAAESIAGSVKTNQIGFLPVSTKMAYAGNYLGDLGVLDISPGNCQIINSQSKSVAYSADMAYRGTDLHMFGEKVYACDFSALTAPGTYFVYVPGVGRSYDFKIADDVYDNAAYTMARGLFYQRASINLDPQYAGKWSRAGGHMITNAIIHESQKKSPLYDNEVIGSTISMPRGWYDAGDYGKYVISSAPTLNEILDAYELFPEKFTDKALNIPESGNGVPDILDEAKWELDWLKEMQAPDGGVFHKVTSVNYARVMPADDNSVMYLSEKDTHSTAMYVASLAKAYRILKPFFPEYANNLLVRAKKSWAFLNLHPETVTFSASGCGSNPSGIGGGANALCRKDNEERAWAAAELYKSTGESQYNTDFIKYWKVKNTTFGENYTLPEDSQRKASFTYATTQYPTDTAIIATIKSAYSYEGSNVFGKKAGAAIFSNNLYRSCSRQDLDVAIGWGQFAHSIQYSWQLIKGYFITGNETFLDTAKICFDTQLGSNPQSMSYITGLGHDYPRRPFNTESALDGIDDPVPGLAVFGPFGHMPNSNPYYAAAQSTTNLYPSGNATADPYPVTRRYYDARLVPMGEYTKIDMSYTLAAFHFFSTLGNSAKNCSNAWSCGDWGQCASGKQYRSCVDANNCSNVASKPFESQDCNGTICLNNWTCSAWSSCSSGNQTRTCSDSNNCITAGTAPQTIRPCVSSSNNSNSSNSNSAPAAAAITTPAQNATANNTSAPATSASTQSPLTFFAGQLVKAPNSTAVYHLGTDGKRRLFVNEVTFWSWRNGPWSNQPVRTLSQAEFDALPVGNNITARAGAKLIKFDNSSKVYAVSNGNRLCYVSAGYGDNWRERVITIQSSFENDYARDASCDVTGNNYRYPAGTLIKYQGSNIIYYIENGKKREVTKSIFKANGFKNADVIGDVNAAMTYTTGPLLNAWE